jgi:hypothetical protein
LKLLWRGAKLPEAPEEMQMSAVTIQQMADRVAELMEQKLHLRGRGLAEKTRKAGRMLPKKVRLAAESLAQAAATAQNPKMYLLLDAEKVAADYDICLKHLGAVPAGGRARTVLVTMASGVAFSVLAVAVLVLAVVWWRGLV